MYANKRPKTIARIIGLTIRKARMKIPATIARSNILFMTLSSTMFIQADRNL